ncbi:hypothetical protein Vadar_020034 [Vaccinium darrowii]|uniref:Uncharacterized protein n=1 Tax=Vaccinium darrowii TaxID=229202 RepID=A0ACB7Y7P0_9ERIC|nr:hypothetical protein Vadar_020034 [Vaccinium darrowii]
MATRAAETEEAYKINLSALKKIAEEVDASLIGQTFHETSHANIGQTFHETSHANMSVSQENNEATYGEGNEKRVKGLKVKERTSYRGGVMVSRFSSVRASIRPVAIPTIDEEFLFNSFEYESQRKSNDVEDQDGDTFFKGVGGGEGIGEGRARSNGIKYLKKGNAACWQHFDRVEINGKVKAICLYCKTILATHSGNGTKALIEHHKRCPRRKVADSSQKVLTQSFITGEGKKKLEAYTFDQNFARIELACMIIIYEYPLSMVEHAGFKRFTMALQPFFQMVPRNTLKADIFKIYDGERLKAMKVLGKIQSRVAVTTDMWTSSNQKRGFMDVDGSQSCVTVVED